MASVDFVAIQIGGHYLQAGPPRVAPFSAILSADGVGIGPRTVFRRIELQGAHAGSRAVAFMLHDGRVLEAFPEPDGGEILASATTVTQAARFEEVWLTDDRIALRTSFNTYVTAEDGGLGDGPHPMSTDRDAVDEWEKFYYEVVPVGLIPADFHQPPWTGELGRAVDPFGGIGKHDKAPIELPPPADGGQGGRRRRGACAPAGSVMCCPPRQAAQRRARAPAAWTGRLSARQGMGLRCPVSVRTAFRLRAW